MISYTFAQIILPFMGVLLLISSIYSILTKKHKSIAIIINMVLAICVVITMALSPKSISETFFRIIIPISLSLLIILAIIEILERIFPLFKKSNTSTIQEKNLQIWKVPIDLQTQIKTPEEISKLKQNWMKDPVWDIYNTEGFEAHKQELHQFQEEQEKIWEEKAKKENEERIKYLLIIAEELGFPGNTKLAAAIENSRELAQKVEFLENQLNALKITLGIKE